MRCSLFSLFVFWCAASAPLNAEQFLHVQYPEIRLADKRVLTHARVESFNGLVFCITHDGGIAGAVPWEIMPSVWQSAFPRDPQLAVKIREKALAAETKSPPRAIDLKQRSPVGGNRSSQHP
jgi:hypothetical protein